MCQCGETERQISPPLGAIRSSLGCSLPHFHLCLLTCGRLLGRGRERAAEGGQTCCKKSPSLLLLNHSTLLQSKSVFFIYGPSAKSIIMFLHLFGLDCDLYSFKSLDWNAFLSAQFLQLLCFLMSMALYLMWAYSCTYILSCWIFISNVLFNYFICVRTT